jgi:hypothetical protein
MALRRSGMRPNSSDLPCCVGLDFDDEARGPSEESLAGIQNWVIGTLHTRRRVTPAVAWLFRHVPTRWTPALAARLGSKVPLMHPSEPEYWVASNRQRKTNNFSPVINECFSRQEDNCAMSGGASV